MKFQEWWDFMEGDTYAPKSRDAARKAWDACRADIIGTLKQSIYRYEGWNDTNSFMYINASVVDEIELDGKE